LDKETAHKKSVLAEYAQRLSQFQPNARKYLVSVVVAGATMGVYRLLFNFFVLSLGYDEALLGNFITTSNTSALLLALPMGYLVDIWGKKEALILRNILLVTAIVVMSIWPGIVIFYVMNVVFGIAQSLGSVSRGPFLMENSKKDERSYLFSFGQGLQMASMFAGNWIGGYLPKWISEYRGVDPQSSTAYAGAMLIVALIGLAGLIPLLMIKSKPKGERRKGVFAPIKFIGQNKALVGKFFFPLLLVSIGAGLFVPFMNIYFREAYNQPDHVVGTLMAWGSLAMMVGLLIAPPLADRIGKLKLVVLTQGLSIPFMVILGFSPLFGLSAAAYYVRMALMNMSNPIYQNFVYEQVDEKLKKLYAVPF
jgi:MFS family permease